MGKTGPKPRSKQQAWEHLKRNARIDNNGCWLIEYGVSIGIGYKIIHADHHQWYAHRLAFQMENGEVYPESVIRHSCDHPNCVNPQHLFIGSHADNVADTVAKRRHQFGMRHYKSVLTNDDVRAIRASNKNLGDLSRQFGISRGGILKIRNRESWKHVE